MGAAFFGRGGEHESQVCEVDTGRTRGDRLYLERATPPHQSPKPQQRKLEFSQQPGVKAEWSTEEAMAMWGVYVRRENVSYESGPMPKKMRTEAPKQTEVHEEMSKGTLAKWGGSCSSRAEKGTNGEVMFSLSGMKYASVSKFRGRKFVSIREWYEKDGELLPGRKGISLSIDQWNTLQSLTDDINHALKTS